MAAVRTLCVCILAQQLGPRASTEGTRAQARVRCAPDSGPGALKSRTGEWAFTTAEEVAQALAAHLANTTISAGH